MKIIRLLLITALATPAFIHCSRDVEISSESTPPALLLQAQDKILRVHESSIVNLQIADAATSDYIISWWTNMGQVDAAGSNFRFTAPDIDGVAVIKVDVRDRQHQIFSDSTEIRIYKQLVFLKADDLEYDRANVISPRWQAFIELVKSKKIKASLGLIGTSLEKGSIEYFAVIKRLSKSGRFEIWNHGYTHTLQNFGESGEIYNEFQNTAYAYQKDHLLKTQHLSKSKLGLTLRTFGAPGNRIDANTIIALDEIAELKVWYFGLPDASKLVLKRVSELEFPVGHPDFAQFVERYNPAIDYLVLQLHPNAWNDAQFAEFEKTIDFLIKQNVTFINPYEYYQLMH